MSVNNPSPSPKAKTNMTKPKEPAPASTSTPRPLPPTSPTIGPPQLEKLKELWEAVCGAATPMPKWMLTATQTQMAATLHDTLRLAGGGAASTTAETMNAPATTQRTTTEKAPTPARPDANQKTGRVKAEPPSPPRRFFVDIVRPAPRYLDDKRVDDDVDDESDVGSSIKDEVKLEEDRSLSLFSSSGNGDDPNTSHSSQSSGDGGTTSGSGISTGDSSSTSSSMDIRLPSDELSNLRHSLVLSPPRHPAGRIPVPPIPFPIPDVVYVGRSGPSKGRSGFGSGITKTTKKEKEKEKKEESKNASRKVEKVVIDLTLDDSDGDVRVGGGQRQRQRQRQREDGSGGECKKERPLFDPHPSAKNGNGPPAYSALPRPSKGMGIGESSGQSLAPPILGKRARARGGASSRSYILIDDDDDDDDEVVFVSQSTIPSPLHKSPTFGGDVKRKNKRQRMDTRFGAGSSFDYMTSSNSTSTSTQACPCLPTSISYPYHPCTSTCPHTQIHTQEAQQPATSTSSSIFSSPFEDPTDDQSTRHLKRTIHDLETKLTQSNKELSRSHLLLADYHGAFRELVGWVFDASDSTVLPDFDSDDEGEGIEGEDTTPDDLTLHQVTE